jgi:protein-S-isoprenylcysteine O-methyltransferase Ste14
VLLGAAVGFGVGVLGSLLLVLRSSGEERLLARELAGYEKYRQRVRYRSLPYVW